MFNKKITRALLEPGILHAYLEPCQTSMMEIFYLQRYRSRHPGRKQFALLDYTVYFSPDGTFEPFVEVNGCFRWRMMIIQSISIRPPKIDPSNLKISKLLFNLFFFAVLIFLKNYQNLCS